MPLQHFFGNQLLMQRGGYFSKVLGTGPIAYWPSWELAGVTAQDLVNSPAQDGTYTGVTLGQPGIGDGRTCPLFDGANDFVDIYSATLNGVFDGSEGSIALWAKVSGIGVWTDGVTRHIVNIGVDTAANYVDIRKNAANNRLTYVYEAGNVPEVVNADGLVTVDWMHLAITWSSVADEMKAYFGGAQTGATQAVLGAWAGNLNANLVSIGSRDNSIPERLFDGFLAHVAVWDTPLTGPQIANLAVV